MSILDRLKSAFASPKADQPSPATAKLWTDTAVSQLIALLTKIPEGDDLLTQAQITRASLKKLETDDEIFAALRTRREAVVSTPWRLEGGDEGLTQLLTEELTPLMPQIVAGAWKAVPYGYSVMEAVYRYREDRKIGLSTVGVKPLEWFDPRPDGELRYFSPDGGNASGEVVDQVFKFFLTRSDPTYQQPKGEALLSRLYWPWFFRFNGWRFWGQFIERFGQPLLVGKNSKPTDMAAALLQAHQDAVIAIGVNDSVEAISPATSGEAFEKLEQCIVRRYQKLILGQTLTSDTGTSGGGSYALGQVHADVKEGLRLADIRLVNATIQRIVNALCSLNGATTNIPSIVFADDAGLEAERADRDTKLYGLGVRFEKGYFTDRYDLKEEDFTLSAALPVTGQPGAPKSGGNALPTDEEGAPTNPQQAAAAVTGHDALTFARRRVGDPKRFTLAQQMVEDSADESLTESGQPIDTEVLKTAVLAAKDPADLADRLAVLMQDAPNEKFQRTLEKALFEADVIGYVHAEGKL